MSLELRSVIVCHNVEEKRREDIWIEAEEEREMASRSGEGSDWAVGTGDVTECCFVKCSASKERVCGASISTNSLCVYGLSYVPHPLSHTLSLTHTHSLSLSLSHTHK
jgi:hypothetical protein